MMMNFDQKGHKDKFGMNRENRKRTSSKQYNEAEVKKPACYMF